MIWTLFRRCDRLSLQTLQFLTIYVEICHTSSSAKQYIICLISYVERCLDSVLRVIFPAHASQFKSDVGDGCNLQTNIPGTKKHQRTSTLISTGYKQCRKRKKSRIYLKSAISYMPDSLATDLCSER